MNKFAPLHPKVSTLLHGADYNPEQWENAPDIIDKDIASNTVILGPNDALFQKALLAENCNLIAIDKLEAPLRVTAKTRYRQKDVPAVIEPLADGKIKVTFDEPQRAITPGQAVVFYDGDYVVGGGIIAAPLKE